MATNGNRWLKERGGKNPLTRMMEQKSAGSGETQINLGSTWVHKVTGLRFDVEVMEDETVLLEPQEDGGSSLEVSAEQFRTDFVPAHAYRPPTKRKSSGKRGNRPHRHKRRGGANARR